MVLDKVSWIIAEILNIARGDLDVNRDLILYGLDSARAMDLIIELEEHFRVEIPDEVIAGLRTASDIARTLEGL